MTDQKMRAEFESAYNKLTGKTPALVAGRGYYANLADQIAWQLWQSAWQAAIAQREAQEPVFTEEEWNGILYGDAVPGDMLTGESLPAYLARTVTAAPSREVPEEWRKTLEQVKEACLQDYENKRRAHMTMRGMAVAISLLLASKGGV